ncbi:MAG TPA: hypothetical protein PKE39_11415 [Ignavibacteria bacterium]|nr:hypothetical protein [Ignavibacteria bacterium]HMQ99622.1 hypothetical protein [Ignavibacteria bacterium]
MNTSKQLHILRKILIYLQIPVYILAVKFVVSFFFKVDGVSESIDNIFNYFLWVLVFAIVASGIVAAIMIVLAYAKRNVLLYLALALVALAVLFTYLFNFAGHWMFFVIPLIVVLYHAVIFTVHGRVSEN